MLEVEVDHPLVLSKSLHFEHEGVVERGHERRLVVEVVDLFVLYYLEFALQFHHHAYLLGYLLPQAHLLLPRLHPRLLNVLGVNHFSLLKVRAFEALSDHSKGSLPQFILVQEVLRLVNVLFRYGVYSFELLYWRLGTLSSFRSISTHF